MIGSTVGFWNALAVFDVDQVRAICQRSEYMASARMDYSQFCNFDHERNHATVTPTLLAGSSSLCRQTDAF